jgi:hypothetical protein
MTNVSGSLVCPIFPEDPETLVIHQKMMLGNNPYDFKQHYDHGGSLQLRKYMNVQKSLLKQLLHPTKKVAFKNAV